MIPDDVAAIPGITTEFALAHGIAEGEALEGFMEVFRRSGLRVVHNISVDDRIVHIGLKRFFGGTAADEFKAGPSYCTCQSSKNIVKCPPTEKMIRAGFGKQFKVPTVTGALKHFYNEDLVAGTVRDLIQRPVHGFTLRCRLPLRPLDQRHRLAGPCLHRNS